MSGEAPSQPMPHSSAITCPPPESSLASRLTFLRRGGDGWSRLDSADDGELLQTVTRVAQQPHPITIDHALLV